MCSCIEEASFVRTLSHIYSKDGSHSHSWNDEYHSFEYQLDQWVVEKLLHNSDKVIIRELKFYIEDCEVLISRTRADLLSIIASQHSLFFFIEKLMS